MDFNAMLGRLRASAAVIQAQVDGVDEGQARWKPAATEWSMLEVVNHLADEEVEDFRKRLELTLLDPGASWPPIDPPRWAVERRYNERELDESVRRFREERSRTLDWLSALERPDWDRSHAHPVLGAVSAGDLLTSWVAHDLIHVRQLNRLQRQYLVSELSPYESDYAGPW